MARVWFQTSLGGLGGNITYAELPTGGGTWANGGALSITGGALTIGADPGGSELLRVATQRVNRIGVGAAATTTDGTLVIGGAGSFLSFLSRDVGSPGGIWYSPTASDIRLFFAADALLFSPTYLKPAVATGLTFGSAALPWGASFFNALMTIQSGGLTVTAGGITVTAGGLIVNGGQLAVSVDGAAGLTSGLALTNQTNQAGASAGTLANAPAVGNPNFYIPVNVNGVLRKVPAW